MRRSFIFLSVFFPSLLFACNIALASEVVTPTTIANTSVTLNVGQPTPGDSWRVFDTTGAPIYDSPTGNADPAFSIFVSTGATANGTYHVIYYNTGDYPSCTADNVPDNYATCASSGAMTNDFAITVGSPPPPPSPGNNFAQMLASTSQGFGTTTGFQISDLIRWSGQNLIGLFIGSGLDILVHMRYWLVAMIIIASIIYFTRQAYIFFRH